MFSLLAYGSLLHQGELSHLGVDPARGVAVTVCGFKRSFNQEPTWRRHFGHDRAVLNVEPCERHSFNAILISGLAETDFAIFDERERGYERIAVCKSRLSPFSASASPYEDDETFLYCGRAEKRNEELLPNRSYLETCLQGASQWGEDFRDAFLRTTYIQEKTAEEFLILNPV